ncbi:efflux RND transporter periplasmic adaptor subunit [Chthonobacter rhizosphaerae]|uniref:efflux RND transporter periplasmic adaptor subunit n=1 Tax=Chthonobacter rhizosphaerae TaxID=2735553 RepID=UPI0015EE8D25|nr:efflux RND transporter periplasmic adaptor subunit [Chthonobacter rhizosphaerae]
MSRSPILSALLGATILIAAPAAPAAAADPAPAAATAPKPPAISVVTASRQEIVAEAVVTGSLVPRDEVAVGVDLDGLRIEAYTAEEGDTVAAGDVLVRLATDTIEIQLAQNTSQVARAEAAIAQAKAQIAEVEASEAEAAAALVRARSLNEKGFTSQEVLDQRVAAAESAKARLSSARQGLMLAEADLALTRAQRAELELRRSKTEIRAPAGGLVLTRSAKVGSIVSPGGGALYTIARDGLIELDADVTETALSRIAVGMKTAVTPAGFGEPVEGSIRLISPQVDPATRLGRVRIALPRHDALKTGAFARGVVEIARSTGVVVPVSAVLIDGKSATVQVVKDGRIETRTVTLGLSGDGVLEIRDGVAEGETIVARAGTFVRDGDLVTPVAAVNEGAKG